MTTASAPGKIILFGEHAVVSGATALGGAIDLRASVSVQDRPGGIVITTEDLMLKGFSIDLQSGRLFSSQAAHAVRYISAVLQEFEAHDIEVNIKSSLPASAGLGSSAAIVVSAVMAISRHQGISLSLKKIADLSFRLEREVQDGLASPTDTALATYGGYLKISSQISPLDLPPMELVVGYTGVPHSTRSEVEKVQKLKKKYPELIDGIFQAIGMISDRAQPLMADQNKAELGQLMNINHGLLEAIGVGSRELCELVYASRGAGGALGAKITGAGGGGCMIAIPGPAGKEPLMTAIRQAGGRPFATTTGQEGVRLEREA
ncbi:MAG: Mevalonate kinase [Euryarchaeota archaeon ADurb.Bin190]|nr:mevalonate kinase [Methanothrix sp.]OQB26060.1 MAG: Mevalonate kinase [Euryarchaeota archaeon ADurb.Bin190]HNQ54015.1 mevalonate kinase [Methanothrix sp.]HNU38861.1 mevalonate kinase [Methanothrix sp.]HPH48510.1 mevalonate kinase [Methanothrix sp.]